jgi:hypothetical protein
MKNENWLKIRRTWEGYTRIQRLCNAVLLLYNTTVIRSYNTTVVCA